MTGNPSGITNPISMTTTASTARSAFCRQSWHRRLSQKAAPAPIPSHGRRKGAHLAHHAALWAARRSLGVTEAALAAGIGGGWAWRALGSRSGQKKSLSTLIL